MFELLQNSTAFAAKTNFENVPKTYNYLFLIHFTTDHILFAVKNVNKN